MNERSREPEWHDLIYRLSEKVAAAVEPTVLKGQPYAVLDFPDYSNVGDSAIWLGTLALLQTLYGYDPAYVSKKDNFSQEELQARTQSRGTIYFLGGGNFGTLYRRHQDFRETLWENYKSRVVQLPQSLHYDETADMSRIRDIARSINPILMVRDQASFRVASEIGFEPVLVPDAAFCLGPLPRKSPTQDVVVLRRSDKEANRDGALIAGVDWVEEPKSIAAGAKMKAAMKLPKYPRFALYQELADRRLRRGVNILSAGSVVKTDRLHGHIMSMLLGIPNIVADNSTGKVHGFIDQWTGSSPMVKKVSSLD